MRRSAPAHSASCLFLLLLLLLLPLGLTPAAQAQAYAATPGGTGGAPSRPADKSCAWESVADANLGFSAWVQRCNLGFRKIDFLLVKSSLVLRYSDGGKPEPVVDVLDLLPGETPAAGIQRLFKARTTPKLAARCVLRPFRAFDGAKPPAGVERFTFVPDAAYQKELAKKADPNVVGDPPCGDLGESPDGIQYFEAQPATGARKVLFVRVGQDQHPLFDEQTLRLLAPRASASH